MSLRQRRDSLWMLAAAPTIWAAHFLASYLTAAIWCARVANAADLLAGVRITVIIYTVAAVGALTLLGWLGWKHHRAGSGELPHDSDSPTGRHRFLGFATFLLSGLSAVAVVFQTLPIVFIGDCR